ncbi:MAG: ABC transporter ATP-binding protein [Chloroflexota bacterium]
MAGLELQGLHKQFGEVVALKSLNLSVKSGEFVSLLGPSGCGKTTALRIIAGFERSDGGQVLLDGKDITRVPASKRDMGMVFQAYSLFPNMTARGNVEFGLRIRGKSRTERSRRAAELLEMVGLATAMDRYPHQLSGGQQQRVALARALAIEPQMLLLDEPLSALDAKVRVQLREEIRRIQTRLGITTLYVTHDQEEALSGSDRVVVLLQGQIEQVGPPAEIYGDPQTVFVAEFIGTMNRMTGTISRADRQSVDCGGTSLRFHAARDFPAGKDVLVLIRPESVEVERLPNGSTTLPGGISGAVAAHTFLGPITRLNVDSPLGSIMVDTSSVQALSLEVGAQVALTLPPEAPRLIDLVPNGQGRASAPQLQGMTHTPGNG